jgi:hypothetical protein
MMSIQQTARTTGFLYLILAAISAYSLVYIPSLFLVPGDVATTISNIAANNWLFRVGIVSNLLAFTVNILVVALLHKLLVPVHKGAALLMVVFILVGIAIAMLKELNQVAILLLSSAGYIAAFTAEQQQALVSLFLNLYEHGFLIAHVFFGLWLLPMGYLIYKSEYLPKFIGVFLIIACFGYLIDFILYFLFPTVNVHVSDFTFVGEVFLLLWLLIKGINVEKWEQRTRNSGTNHKSTTSNF